MAAKAGNREDVASSVTRQAGMGNPQGDSVATVKCTLKRNIIIIYYFCLWKEL